MFDYFVRPVDVALRLACQLRPPKRYLEIGVNRGRSLGVVLENSRGLTRLVLCDLWGDNPKAKERIEGLLRDKGILEVAEFLSGKSQETIPTLREEFDLILVDGDHSVAEAKQDVRNSWERLRPRGLLVLDDVIGHPELGELFTKVCKELPANPVGWIYGATGAAIMEKP